MAVWICPRKGKPPRSEGLRLQNWRNACAFRQLNNECDYAYKILNCRYATVSQSIPAVNTGRLLSRKQMVTGNSIPFVSTQL